MATGRYRTQAALAALLLTIAAGSPATAIERLATYRDAFVEFERFSRRAGPTGERAAARVSLRTPASKRSSAARRAATPAKRRR
jgi:hypothetical protein